MDPVTYMTTEDDTLRLAMLAVAERSNELDTQLGERRAAQIANAVAKTFNG